MSKTIEKVSETEIKVTTSTDAVVTLDDMIAELRQAENDLQTFNAWAEEEQAARQAIVNEKQARIDEAVGLGTKTASQVASEVSADIANEKTS